MRLLYMGKTLKLENQNSKCSTSYDDEINKNPLETRVDFVLRQYIRWLVSTKLQPWRQFWDWTDLPIIWRFAIFEMTNCFNIEILL